jgi:hypothetical protein
MVKKMMVVVGCLLVTAISMSMAMGAEANVQKAKGEQLADLAAGVGVKSLQFSEFTRQDLNEAVVIAAARGDEKAAVQLERLKKDKIKYDRSKRIAEKRENGLDEDKTEATKHSGIDWTTITVVALLTFALCLTGIRF